MCDCVCVFLGGWAGGSVLPQVVGGCLMNSSGARFAHIATIISKTEASWAAFPNTLGAMGGADRWELLARCSTGQIYPFVPVGGPPGASKRGLFAAALLCARLVLQRASC